MERTLMEPEHRDFRESFRAFMAAHVAADFKQWEERGIVPRELYREAGRRGFLAFEVPPEHGGAGVEDFRFNVVVGEEAHGAGYTGFAAGITLHNDVCLPYFTEYATAEQRERWLPGIASGELFTAIALTEPQTGSDLAGIATRAEPVDGGYLVNGSKTFITNGLNAELVITAVRTSKEERHAGLSLLVISSDTPGFAHGRNLEKIGMHSQDTAELFFEDMFVPSENLLGEEGRGFYQLTSNLPRERLSIAVAAVASAQATLSWTLEYVRTRKAFGKPIGSFQNSRFVLAELHADVTLAQTFVDLCTERLDGGELTPQDAAIAKWWSTELQGRVVDGCLQLHGGYGYMTEYPVARAFMDARVSRIYGGTTEIMKEIVARGLGL
jgi:alkylation response protein AidB-like acyl-CoA dehydrogenase